MELTTIVIGAVVICILVVALTFFFVHGSDPIVPDDKSPPLKGEDAGMIQIPTIDYLYGEDSGNWRYGEREPYYKYRLPNLNDTDSRNFKIRDPEVVPANVSTVHDEKGNSKYSPIETIMMQEGWGDPHKIMVPYRPAYNPNRRPFTIRNPLGKMQGESLEDALDDSLSDGKFQSLPAVVSTGIMTLEADAKYRKLREIEKSPIVNYATKMYGRLPYLRSGSMGKEAIGQANIGGDFEGVNFATNLNQVSRMLPQIEPSTISHSDKSYVMNTF